ncbi:MAG: mechanosensitive ion channel [Gammaproteobacteria bacterium]|nr:MAG: mechanosensitive ion channel [Gammaproteobacteria bacterium]
MNIEELLPKIQEYGITWTIVIVKAIAIFFIGRIVARVVVKVIDKLMKRSDMDEMLRKFLRNIAFAILMIFVVIATISSLGIQTASLVAVLGAAGLAIGLALQGSLSNFAAGVLMIIFRPYKLGDLVNVADTVGFVEEVDVFTTTLRLPDKTKIIIPNGQIMDAKITNFMDSETRRLDLEVGIGYGDDIDTAKEVLLSALKTSDYVLESPAPKVTVASLGDSSVNLAVRPWIRSADYAPASHDVTELIKKTLDANGINIPFPQRDVHMYRHGD